LPSVAQKAETQRKISDAEKENKEQNTKSKKVKFAGHIDDDGETWQGEEIKKLEARVAELLVENQTLRQRLQKEHYEKTYRENERMEKELQNMYLIQGENDDLKEEVERLKWIDADEKSRQLEEENKRLRARNGELLIKASDLEEKVAAMEKATLEQRLTEEAGQKKT